MKALKCEMCGSNDVVKQEDLFVCQNCGTKYSVEAARKMMIEGTVEVKGTVTIDESQKIQTWITFAETALNAGNLKEAYDYANKILELTPNSIEAWMVRMKCVSKLGSLENPRTGEIISIGENIIALDHSQEEEVGLFFVDTGTQMLRSGFSLINGEVDKESVFHNTEVLDKYCDQAIALEKAAAGYSVFKNSEAIQAKGDDFVGAYQDFTECLIDYIHELNPYDKETIGNLNKKYEAVDIMLRKDFPNTSYFVENQDNTNLSQDEKRSGCYVATAVYGSYNCPEVWALRRFRDNTLDVTWYGRVFIKTYYAISPTLVKWFGETSWFKRLWRKPLDKLVTTLRSKGVKDTPYYDKY